MTSHSAGQCGYITTLETTTMRFSRITVNDGLYATDASPMLGFIDESQLTAGMSAAAAMSGAI